MRIVSHTQLMQAMLVQQTHYASHGCTSLFCAEKESVVGAVFITSARPNHPRYHPCDQRWKPQQANLADV